MGLIIFLARFKFKSNKKNKINFLPRNEEVFQTEMTHSHLEMFSNKKIILEGCKKILEYRDDFIKLKLKKGSVTICGSDFLISDFEMECVTVLGCISSLEFCI